MPKRPSFHIASIDLNFDIDILDKRGQAIPRDRIPQQIDSDVLSKHVCDLADEQQVSQLIKTLEDYPPRNKRNLLYFKWRLQNFQLERLNK